MNLPFEGGISSLGNGTLILALAAAFAHAFIASEPPTLRRIFAAAGPAIVFCTLCVVTNGPLRLTLTLLALVAGEALLAQKDERFRAPAMIAFGIAGLLLLWTLVGAVALVLAAGAFSPRVGFAVLGAVAILAGAALSLAPGMPTLPPAFAPALRHLGVILLSVASLS